MWNFLRPYVEHYDAAIFSMPDFAQQLPLPQIRVAPSIDPLADKNKPLGQCEINRVLEKHKINPAIPILTQISRFDRLKDPLGVIAAYRIVKKRHKCQLVLAGGGAPDDPEGEAVLNEVQEAAASDPGIHVLLLPPFSDIEINALVRASTIVIQKSIREGFGLTVSEALWKKKPVIGGAVGGIKLQILDGVTGYLVHSPEGAANRIAQLLGDRRLTGAHGRKRLPARQREFSGYPSRQRLSAHDSRAQPPRRERCPALLTSSHRYKLPGSFCLVLSVPHANTLITLLFC